LAETVAQIKDLSAQKAKLVHDMKRAEADLSRIRAGRDHLQGLVDQRVAKDAVTLTVSKEVERMNKAQRERIVCLESETTRLALEIDSLKGSGSVADADTQHIERIKLLEKVVMWWL
jgi:uncharacterized protein (DUF3084 family)